MYSHLKKSVSIILVFAFIWISGCLSYGKANTVKFTDKKLEAVIRAAVGKHTGDILTTDVKGIVELDATEKNISDLKGIQYLTGLKRLFLYGNQITDLSPLKTMTQLEELYLCDNRVSNISVLSNLVNLTGLSLARNRVSEISSLKYTTKLTVLNLSGNPIKDFNPVSGYYKKLIYKDFDLKAGSSPQKADYPSIEELYPRELLKLPSFGHEAGTIAASYSDSNLLMLLAFTNEVLRDRGIFASLVREGNIKASNGETLVEWNLSMGKIKVNDYYVTTIFDDSRIPVCAFYTTKDEKIDYDAAMDAYNSILDGKLDIPYRLAWVYMTPYNVKNLTDSKLRAIVSNNAITDEKLDDILKPIAAISDNSIKNSLPALCIAYAYSEGHYTGQALEVFKDGLYKSVQTVLGSKNGIGYEKVYRFFDKADKSNQTKTNKN